MIGEKEGTAEKFKSKMKIYKINEHTVCLNPEVKVFFKQKKVKIEMLWFSHEGKFHYGYHLNTHGSGSGAGASLKTPYDSYEEMEKAFKEQAIRFCERRQLDGKHSTNDDEKRWLAEYAEELKRSMVQLTLF
jgi:hypothetical protein